MLFSTPAWWEMCHTPTKPCPAQVTAVLCQRGLRRRHICPFSAAPSRAPRAGRVQQCLSLKCFDTQHNSKEKCKSTWRVINEQSWLTVRSLAWSNIVLSPKLFPQKIITEGPISTRSSRMLTLPLFTVLLLLLMGKNRLANSNVFYL